MELDNAIPKSSWSSQRALLEHIGELELWRSAFDNCAPDNMSCGATGTWTIRTAMLDPD